MVVRDDCVTLFSLSNPTKPDIIVPAHKFILYARSPFFRTLFQTDEGAKLENYGVPNADRPVVMLLLEYLYTDYVTNLNTKLAEALAPLAAKYAMATKWLSLKVL